MACHHPQQTKDESRKQTIFQFYPNIQKEFSGGQIKRQYHQHRNQIHRQVSNAGLCGLYDIRELGGFIDDTHQMRNHGGKNDPDKV